MLGLELSDVTLIWFSCKLLTVVTVSWWTDSKANRDYKMQTDWNPVIKCSEMLTGIVIYNICKATLSILSVYSQYNRSNLSHLWQLGDRNVTIWNVHKSDSGGKKIENFSKMLIHFYLKCKKKRELVHGSDFCISCS